PYASGRSFHSKDPTTDPLSPLSLHDALPISQQALADSLKLTRGRYAKYEDGANEPPIEVLVGMSKYFKISLDLLLTVDLAKYPIDRKSTRLNSSHVKISYAVFCLKKKKQKYE